METVDTAPDEFEVWPENDLSLGIFLRCTTQWRFRIEGRENSISSRISGLDYTAVEAVMRLYQVENAGEVFNDIRAMELAVLEKVNES